MPVLADEPWRVLSPDSDEWRYFAAWFPALANLPGYWEIRGHEWPDEYRFMTMDGAQVRDLAARLRSETRRVAVLDLGGIELRYYPPGTRRTVQNSRWRRWWTVVAGILVKLKLVLVFGSIVLSMVVYGLALGWAYGVGLVALIAIHESGHVVANRRKGIPASLPIFIPLLGAFIQLKQFPKNAADEAFIGIMGPLFGLGATLVALGVGLWAHSPLFLAVAEMGFLLHVFNLMPVLPLDGGRTVGFWRWKAWIPGMLGVLLVLFYNPLTNRITFDPLTVLIVALIIFSLSREPRSHGPVYQDIAPRTRWGFTALWGAAFAVSLLGYWTIGTLRIIG
ncbi:MAG: site-2 protease family protein [Firmicutes bacterium]|nr:site-2 protease family protein [Bacillota bacterium]